MARTRITRWWWVSTNAPTRFYNKHVTG